MIRKIVAVWVSLAIMLSIIVIIIEIAQVVEAPTTWYVDDVPGSGGPGDPPEDFTSIQDAINTATEGDTVFVYIGIYYENVVVNKTINLAGEDRDTTIIDGNEIGDVVRIEAHWVNITEFTITRSGSSMDNAGIIIDNVQNCTVDNNNCSFNYIGIHLYTSCRNSIENNNCSNNLRGIQLKGQSTFNIIKNNKISSNEVFGIEFQSTNHNNTIMENNFMNNSVSITASLENKLFGNIFVMGGIFLNGIIDVFTTQLIPINNTVNNKPVYYYKNVNMNNATVPLDAGEVILGNVSWLKIENINFSYGGVGIEIGYSSKIYITNNTFSKNIDGIHLIRSYNNTVVNNTYTYNDQGIYIYFSGNNSIVDNIIYNNMDGVQLRWGSNNTIGQNTFEGNNVGIYSTFSTDNIIVNNLFESNNKIGTGGPFAIFLGINSKYNQVYHNNFIKNIMDAYDNRDNYWDNGYPSGGNYWSKYNGDDIFKGPDQDIPGSDGIGDTNLSIPMYSLDRYPLMSPIGKYIFLREGWNLISIPIIQHDTNPSTVLYPITNSFDSIQWFNANDNFNHWKHNSTNKPYKLNDLNDIDHTMGFWIHITEPGGVLFEYSGTQPTSNQTIPLHPGWNMDGYPSLTSYNRTEGLNNLTFNDQVDAIWSYDTSTQKWEEMGESDYFEIGKGYYIHAKSECEWEVPL